MSGRRSVARGQGRARTRGQGLVEYAMTVPLFLLILLGMIEFGFAFAHNLTLEYGTREGARVGSALANGGGTLGCNPGQSPNAADVDPEIIAAVQRVLTSPGSQVNLNDIGSIHIYQSTASGTEGSANVWKLGAGPNVDGVQLKFTPVAAQQGWSACSRKNGATPDSVGVSLTYDYRYVTPLGSLMGFAGSPTMHMSDRTVMALNPTQ